MYLNIKKLLIFQKNLNIYLGVLLLSFFPITFFIGTGILNLIILLIDLIFIFEVIKKRRYLIFKNYTFYLLCILWLSILLNLIFSINFENSLGRSLGFVRFIFFVMAIIYFFNIENGIYKKTILGCWSIIFFITCLDLIYEFIFGRNILGFKSYMPGRLAGFFNDELKIGHFFYGFSLIVSSHVLSTNIFKKLKNFIKQENLIFIFFILLIFISFIIGERSNFIKTFIMLSVFVIFSYKFFNKINILIIISLLLIFISTINLKKGYKTRFINQFIKPVINHPIDYIKSSNYVDHYKFGIKVFLENKLFGVGLKNYRTEVVIKTIEKENINASIHPHQTHIEILSELGMFGYLSFILFFIYSYINSKKNISLENRNLKFAGLLFIVTTFIPFLPSGSFFTSHGAAIFWMNYAMMNISTKKF